MRRASDAGVRLSASGGANHARLALPQRLAAIAQRLGDVHAADALGAVEIGERARDRSVRWNPRADRCSASAAWRSKRDALGVGRGDLLENAPAAIALVRTLRGTERCEARALAARAPRATRARTSALPSRRRRQHEVGGADSAGTSICRSMRSSSGPEMRAW